MERTGLAVRSGAIGAVPGSPTPPHFVTGLLCDEVDVGGLVQRTLLRATRP